MEQINILDALERAIRKIQEACECNCIENKEDFEDVYQLIKMLKGE